MTQDIVRSYREVDWIFAVYKGIEIVEIFKVEATQMEPMYLKWEAQLATKAETSSEPHLNNPKINLSFVRDCGTIVYSNSQDS